MASNLFVQNVSPPTITITQIDFGGNPTSCDTFCPCAPADNCSFTIGTTGTYNLDVYVTNGILNGCITVTDSLGYIQNQNIGAGYTGIATFTNVTYDGITDIQIVINDNFCAPIPTLTATPNVTPTPCSCSEYQLTISSTDTSDATGNSGPNVIYNGVVVWTYTDCTTGLPAQELLSAGVFNLCGCVDNGLSYWKNNTQQVAINSNTFIVGPCAVSPTPTPTPNITPSSTPASTPTATPPCNCTYYDVIVTSIDIDNAIGNTTPSWNNTVWARYYDCTTGAPLDMIFYAADPYYTAFCNNNLYGTPYLYNHINDTISAVVSSTVTNTLVCCTIDPTPTQTPSNTPTPTPNSTPAVTPSNSPTPDVTPNVTPSYTPTTTPLYVEYQITSFGYGNANLACAALDATSPVYASPLYNVPMVGMVFYDDTNLTIPHNGGGSGQYFLLEKSSTTWGAQVNTIGVLTDYTACSLVPTPTQTQTQTPTPSVTIGATPTQTQTPTNTETPTQTQTPTNTETQTQTPTPSVTIGITPTQTQTQTPTNTETPTQTQTPTNTETQTQTPTQTPTNTETPTQTQTPTNTETPTQTQTPTNTETPTQTQTPTQTYTQTQTPTGDAVVQFQDCSNGSNIFRFGGTSLPTTIGDVYYITGSTDFEGCATIVSTDNSGPIYDAVGVTFTNVSTCIDSLCPRTSIRAALLTKCSNGDVIYANVNEDTAFVGAAYIYNGECYAFVEFSGPGGPDFGDPDFGSCISCVPSPTPTNTPNPTPTNSPTISATPAPCSDTTFCLRTTLTGLLPYNGNYTLTGFYNTRPYYVGDGSTVGYIYHTGSFWCLSNSLGGSCLLQGSVPCYSNCPDISANYFAGGVCPTPTPTPINCNGFDFNAYFDCDWEPVPTPTPSVPCEDVNFDYDFVGITPTPTPTIDCVVGLSFSLSGYTPAVTPTITVTPSITLTRTVDVAGQATFGIFDETFSCVSVKVLQDCSTGMELYTTDSLIYDGIPIVTGITIFATISGVLSCATYLRDDTNFSSNSTIDEIFDIYADCEYCTIVPTPTPTITSTPTQTQTPTTSTTPSQTPTSTITPSPSATVGTTPPVTPSQTQTQTPSHSPTQSMTPTPSVTPNYVYVFQSCSPISPNILPTQVIQTQPIGFIAVVGSIFKDSLNNCWTYNGRFDSTYIAPPTVISITYSGDFFASSPNTLYPSCQECQTIPPPPPCTYIYFNAYRCDTGEAVVVYACNFIDPNNQIKLDYRVGETHAVGDRGSEFCVSLDSIATNASTGYLINTPPYSGPYNCFTCPLYKTYYVNSCDGTTQNLLVYASSTSTTLVSGTVIKTDVSADCYTVVSYEGLVSNPFFLYGFTPQINQIFGTGDCETCLSLN